MPQLPDTFVDRMSRLLGESEADALCRSLAETPPVSIRLNPMKGGSVPTGGAATPVPWCDAGRYLAVRPSFTLDPLFHAGTYYVQEAASMFVAQAYSRMDAPPRRVLDLCAAPGGKSTLWRSLMPEGSLLVANEPLHQRAMILAENMAKWGHPDVAVTNAYPADFAALRGFFDMVAADVPCSGEGMFRKDEGAVAEWSPEAVVRCADRQWQIVQDVWPALREGGYLVYSTCTFNPEEDEENVARICERLGAELVDIPTPPEWGVRGDTTGRGLSVCHFFPHHARGEGFFLALLRKTSPTPTQSDKRRSKALKPLPVAGGKTAASWLADDSRFKLYRPDAQHVAAIRAELADDAERLRAAVRTVWAGVVVAEDKGKKLVPTPELALSTALNRKAFPQASLSREEALAYLRREALTLSPDVPRGYVVACCEGHPLGFLNNLGNRANNLYPAEWRIRMQATPVPETITPTL